MTDRAGFYAQTTSLLVKFVVVDGIAKSAINYLEGQKLALALMNATVSALTCFTVIVLLIMVTRRVHLLLLCGIYYALVFLVFLLLPPRGTIVHGPSDVVLQDGNWTLLGLTGLAVEVGASMAVSLAVLSLLLAVNRLRPR